MSGMVHNVITRRLFDFSNQSASSTQDVPLVRAIDVTDAKAIDLVVRIHSFSLTLASAATITIHARAISLTSEQPDADFTNGTDLCMITLDGTVPVDPSLLLDSLTAPWGQMIRLFVRGSQPASPATLSATLSIDLVVRDN